MSWQCCAVAIYHSSTVTDVTAAIEVETGTVTFRVRCTSTGGRALNMAISGPNGYVSNLTDNVQHVGGRAFMGNDSYTATSGIIYNGRVGDVYQCNVTSVESNTGSVTVQGNAYGQKKLTVISMMSNISADAVSPTLDTIVQTAPTSVRVTWTAPPGVTGTRYRVHFYTSGGSETMTSIYNSTMREISGLMFGRTYIFSVEAIASNRLPSMSEERIITLGELSCSLPLTLLFFPPSSCDNNRS